MHVCIQRAAVIFVVGALLAALCGCSHNPNHDIDTNQARAAADRVHARPKPGEKMIPGGGG